MALGMSAPAHPAPHLLRCRVSPLPARANPLAPQLLQRIKPGYEAEIAFDAIPGSVFKAKVKSVLDVVAQGQLQASGTLIDPASRAEHGTATIIIEVLDDLSSYLLPPGSIGEVAVYSEHWHMFAIIRKILLRMKSWQNFVFH
jgi:hypothetical protein